METRETLVLTADMARRGYNSVREVWKAHADGSIKFGSSVTLVGACVTVRAGNAGKLLFVELLDGSTVKCLQCICDSAPEVKQGAPADPRSALNWTPLFDHCRRGATVEFSGTLESSPAAGQPIELVVQSFRCLGPIPSPDNYFMSGKGFLSRDFLRSIPHQRHHTKLFTAIQIIKQASYWAYHEAMQQLGIGELQPTLISGNECEDGAHPFTVTTLLDGKKTPAEVPVLKETGEFDWSQDFFGKRVFLTVSSQLHLEATVLGTKRDGYCMTTAFRAEPSKGPLHLAEFLMPEWEIIGGGLQRNMAVAQFTLKHMFAKVLDECLWELEFLEEYRDLDNKKWAASEETSIKEKEKGQKQLQNAVKDKEKARKKLAADASADDIAAADAAIAAGKEELAALKDEVASLKAAFKEEKERRESMPSLLSRLRKYRDEPFVVSTHEECVRLLLADEAAGKVKFEVTPGYADDLSRQHEHYITEKIFDQRPVFVRYFPKAIKAFYMPVLDSKAEIPRVDCYDLLFPFVGEVVGGSQRIDSESELRERMEALKISGLDWYLDLRRDASLPHGGAGLGFGRAMIVMMGLHNIKDFQEFPRACGVACFA